MTIIETIKANHNNRAGLLSLANKETLAQVADHFDVTPQKAAPKVAQRLFDAKAITIKANMYTYGKKFSRNYDLTIPSQACLALRVWGELSKSLEQWKNCGEDIYAYDVLAESDSGISKHPATTLSIVRK